MSNITSYDGLLDEYISSQIEISETKFNEVKYKWTNYNHPENQNYCIPIFWIAYHKPDGRFMIGYSQQPSQPPRWIEYGTGDIMEAIKKYV